MTKAEWETLGDKLRREGRQEGRQEGEQVGGRAEARRVLARILETRFGELEDAHRARVGEADLPTLREWIDRALTAANAKAVFGER